MECVFMNKLAIWSNLFKTLISSLFKTLISNFSQQIVIFTHSYLNNMSYTIYNP